MNIQPGDVGFVMHHDNKMSKLIAWFMGSKWSHSFVVISKTDYHIFIAETSDFQVTIGSLDRYLDSKTDSVEIYSKQDADEIMRKAASIRSTLYYGSIYGYLQLLSLGLRCLLKRFGYRIPNFIRWGMVCTAVPLYTWNGIDSTDPVCTTNPESIDTEDLYQLIKGSTNWACIFSKEAV